MAHKRSPQNKAQAQAPETKDKESLLRQLLRAEQNEWAGASDRLTLHNIATSIRHKLESNEDE